MKALITFLVFPTHLGEKGYKATQYSGYLFKTITASDTHHRSTIEVISSFIHTTISKISASTTKQGTQEEIDSSESETSKQDEDTQDKPAKPSKDVWTRASSILITIRPLHSQGNENLNWSILKANHHPQKMKAMRNAILMMRIAEQNVQPNELKLVRHHKRLQV